jgi:myo-inositol catabolism protein IolC
MGKPGFGTLLDDTYGREAMFDAAKLGLWVGRPLEKPGSRPLEFEFTRRTWAHALSTGRSITASSACPSTTRMIRPN